VRCSVHCHSDEHGCGNLSPLDVRPEIAMVEHQGHAGGEIEENLSSVVGNKKRKAPVAVDGAKKMRSRPGRNSRVL